MIHLSMASKIASVLAQSALMLLVIVVADLRVPGITTVAADQKGAYDTVNRQKLMGLVDRRHTPATASLVPMLLQPGTVYTQGDTSMLLRMIDVGLTQGGPDSPALYNILGDDLLQAINRAIASFLESDAPQAAKAFADDLLLQLRKMMNAKRALQACGQWAVQTGQVFNLKKGKSAYLTQSASAPDLDLRISGEPILGDDEFDYLGISISSRGPTDSVLCKRLRAATFAFASLHRNEIFIRGMDWAVAKMVYETFIVAKWTFAVFLVPFTDASRRAADGLDAALITATVVKCAATPGRGSRPTLPILRAVTRLPSPDLRRKTAAHEFAARMLALSTGGDIPPHTRAKAHATRAALSRIPGFLYLVPDPEQPWKKKDVLAARAAEWRRATAGLARPVPPPHGGAHYLPPAMRLRPHWARNLAARYHANTFPILHRPVPRAGPRRRNARALAPLREKAILTREEAAAMETLKLLHRADIQNRQLPAIVTALETLRPRDSWARATPDTTAAQDAS